MAAVWAEQRADELYWLGTRTGESRRYCTRQKQQHWYTNASRKVAWFVTYREHLFINFGLTFDCHFTAGRTDYAHLLTVYVKGTAIRIKADKSTCSVQNCNFCLTVLNIDLLKVVNIFSVSAAVRAFRWHMPSPLIKFYSFPKWLKGWPEMHS